MKSDRPGDVLPLDDVPIVEVDDEDVAASDRDGTVTPPWEDAERWVRSRVPVRRACDTWTRLLAANFLRQRWVQGSIMFFVILSIISLGFSQAGTPDPQWVVVVELVSLVVFTAEALLKVTSRGLCSAARTAGSGVRVKRRMHETGEVVRAVLSVPLLRDEMRRQLEAADVPGRLDPAGVPAEAEMPPGPMRPHARRRWTHVPVERRVRRQDQAVEVGYLQSLWDIADLVVVVVMFLGLGFGSAAPNVTAIRVLRVLRAIRTLEALPDLQVVLHSLVQSCKFLRNVVVVMVFFYFVFAIIGVESMGLALQRRCVDTAAPLLPGTGAFPEAVLPDPEPPAFCNLDSNPIGGLVCSSVQPSWSCSDTGDHPLEGLQSFKNMAYALFVVVQAASLEGWSELAYAVMDAERPGASVYFVLLVLVCNFLVLSLVTSVLIQQFAGTWERFLAKRKEAEASAIEAARKELEAVKAEARGKQATPQSMGSFGAVVAMTGMRRWAARARAATQASQPTSPGSPAPSARRGHRPVLSTTASVLSTNGRRAARKSVHTEATTAGLRAIMSPGASSSDDDEDLEGSATGPRFHSDDDGAGPSGVRADSGSAGPERSLSVRIDLERNRVLGLRAARMRRLRSAARSVAIAASMTGASSPSGTPPSAAAVAARAAAQAASPETPSSVGGAQGTTMVSPAGSSPGQRHGPIPGGPERHRAARSSVQAMRTPPRPGAPPQGAEGPISDGEGEELTLQRLGVPSANAAAMLGRSSNPATRSTSARPGGRRDHHGDVSPPLGRMMSSRVINLQRQLSRRMQAPSIGPSRSRRFDSGSGPGADDARSGSGDEDAKAVAAVGAPSAGEAALRDPEEAVGSAAMPSRAPREGTAGIVWEPASSPSGVNVAGAAPAPSAAQGRRLVGALGGHPARPVTPAQDPRVPAGGRRRVDLSVATSFVIRETKPPGLMAVVARRLWAALWNDTPPHPRGECHRWAQSAVLGKPFRPAGAGPRAVTASLRAGRPPSPAPADPLRPCCPAITSAGWSAEWFSSLVTFASVLMLVVLGLSDPLESADSISAPDVASMVMVGLLAVELAFRAFALGGNCLRSSFLVWADIISLGFGVVATVFFAAAGMGATSVSLGIGGTRGRVFASLLALRSLRIVEGLAPLRQLILTAFRRAAAVGNLVLLLLLCTAVAGLVFTQLLGGQISPRSPGAELPEPRLVFNNVAQSMLTLFVVMTGENWPAVVGNIQAGGTGFAVAFSFLVVLWFLFTNIILLQVFIAVVVEGIAEDDDVKEQRQAKMLDQSQLAIGSRLDEALARQAAAGRFAAELVLGLRAWRQAVDAAGAQARRRPGTPQTPGSASLLKRPSSGWAKVRRVGTAHWGHLRSAVALLHSTAPPGVVDSIARQLTGGGMVGAEVTSINDAVMAAEAAMGAKDRAPGPGEAGDEDADATESKDEGDDEAVTAADADEAMGSGEQPADDWPLEDDELVELRRRKAVTAAGASSQPLARTERRLRTLLDDALALVLLREVAVDRVNHEVSLGIQKRANEEEPPPAEDGGAAEDGPSPDGVDTGDDDDAAGGCGCACLTCGASRACPQGRCEALHARCCCCCGCGRPAGDDTGGLDADDGDGSSLAGSRASSIAWSSASIGAGRDGGGGGLCSPCRDALRGSWAPAPPSCTATGRCMRARAVVCCGRLLDACQTERVRKARTRLVSRAAAAGGVATMAGPVVFSSDSDSEPEGPEGGLGHFSEDPGPARDIYAEASSRRVGPGISARSQSARAVSRTGGLAGRCSRTCGLDAIEAFRIDSYRTRLLPLPADPSDRSLGCLSRDHPVRALANAIICSRPDAPGRTGPLFRGIMLLAIFASSLQLAVESYDVRQSAAARPFFQSLDAFFAVIFAAEATLKIVAFGFVAANHSSYMRRGWNVLDLVVAVSAVLDAFVDSRNIAEDPVTGLPPAWVSLLRLARCLRPLKFLEVVPSTSRLVRAFSRSLGQISAAVLLALVVLVAFAEVGRQFFAGALSSCTDASVISKAACTGLFVDEAGITALRVWTTPTSSFETLPASVSTLMEVATLEGWIGTLTRAMDIRGRDEGPQLNASVQYSFFFVAFIVLAAFVLLPVFTGIVANAVAMERKDAVLTEQQKTVRGVLQQYAPPGDKSRLRRSAVLLVMEEMAARKIEARWRERLASAVVAGTMRGKVVSQAVTMWQALSPQPSETDDTKAEASRREADAAAGRPVSGEPASGPLFAVPVPPDHEPGAAESAPRTGSPGADGGAPASGQAAAVGAARPRRGSTTRIGASVIDVDGSVDSRSDSGSDDGNAVSPIELLQPSVSRRSVPGTPVARTPFASMRVDPTLPGAISPTMLSPMATASLAFGIGHGIRAAPSAHPEALGLAATVTEMDEADADESPHATAVQDGSGDDSAPPHEAAGRPEQGAWLRGDGATPGSAAMAEPMAEPQSRPGIHAESFSDLSKEDAFMAAGGQAPTAYAVQGAAESTDGGSAAAGSSSRSAAEGSSAPADGADSDEEPDVCPVLVVAGVTDGDDDSSSSDEGEPAAAPQTAGRAEPTLALAATSGSSGSPAVRSPLAAAIVRTSTSPGPLVMSPPRVVTFSPMGESKASPGDRYARPGRPSQLTRRRSRGPALRTLADLAKAATPGLGMETAKSALRAALAAPTDTEIARARAEQAKLRNRAPQAQRAFRRFQWGWLPKAAACSSCCCIAAYRFPKRRGPPAYLKAADEDSDESDGAASPGRVPALGPSRSAPSAPNSPSATQLWKVGTLSGSEETAVGSPVRRKRLSRGARLHATTLSKAGWRRIPPASRAIFLQAAKIESRAELAARRADLERPIVSAPQPASLSKGQSLAETSSHPAGSSGTALWDGKAHSAAGTTAATGSSQATSGPSTESVGDADTPLGTAVASPTSASIPAGLGRTRGLSDTPTRQRQRHREAGGAVGDEASAVRGRAKSMGAPRARAAHHRVSTGSPVKARRGGSTPRTRGKGASVIQTPLVKARLGEIPEPLRRDECVRVQCPRTVCCCVPVRPCGGRTLACTSCRCVRDCCPSVAAGCTRSCRPLCSAACACRIGAASRWEQAHFRVRGLVNEGSWFDIIATLLVVINAGFMAASHSPMEPGFATLLDTANTVFLGIFTLELAIRLVAHGCSRPMNTDPWLVFDFVIIVASIVLRSVQTDVGVQAARALRIARLFRVMHLSNSLRVLVDTLTSSISALTSTSVTLLLVLFVYAVIGMQLFGAIGADRASPSSWTDAPPSPVDRFNLTANSTAAQFAEATAWANNPLFQSFEGIHRHAHFRDFGTAALLLFRMATGEDWQLIYHDCSARTGFWANVYFVSFVVLVQAVVLDFYLAGVLEAFERAYHEQHDLMSYRDVASLRAAFDRYDLAAGNDAAGYVPLWAADRILARFARMDFRNTASFHAQVLETALLRCRLRDLGYPRQDWDALCQKGDKETVAAVARTQAELAALSPGSPGAGSEAAGDAVIDEGGPDKENSKPAPEAEAGAAAAASEVGCWGRFVGCCCGRRSPGPGGSSQMPRLTLFTTALLASRIARRAAQGGDAEASSSGALRSWVRRLLRDDVRWTAMRKELRLRALVAQADIFAEEARKDASSGGLWGKGAAAFAAASKISLRGRASRPAGLGPMATSMRVTLASPFASARSSGDTDDDKAMEEQAAAFSLGLERAMAMPDSQLRVSFSSLVTVLALERVGPAFLTPQERFAERRRRAARARIEQERLLLVFARAMRGKLAELRRLRQEAEAVAAELRAAQGDESELDDLTDDESEMGTAAGGAWR